MAWVPRGAANFSVLEDEDCCVSPTNTIITSPLSPRGQGSFDSSHILHNQHYTYLHDTLNPFAALRDLDPNHNTRSNTSLQGSYGSNTHNLHTRAAEDLAEELRKFHIADQSEEDEDTNNSFNGSLSYLADSGDDENTRSISKLASTTTATLSDARTPKSKGRGLRVRPVIEANTFHAPETIEEEDENFNTHSPTSPVSPGTVETVKVANGKQLLDEAFSGKLTRPQQVRRVLDHEFDLFVRLPVEHGSDRTICYGCNILPRSQKNVDRDTYSVIGRPIEDPHVYYMQEPSSPLTAKAPDNLFAYPEPRRPEKMVSRIEDSLEAIDQLEEQLESFGEVTNIDRVVSPEVKRPVTSAIRRHGTIESQRSTKKAASATNTPAHKNAATKTTPGSSRFNTLNPSSLRQASQRISLSFGVEEKKTKSVVRRASLARISSLSEPKNRPAKPAHPRIEVAAPTVARKLREEGDIREKSGRNMLGLGRANTTKPLTRRSFELPSDAVSRRKREERDAKLKGGQEEEEKRRRELKAKPVRSSSVRTSSIHNYPKETIASRARHANKATPVTDNVQHHIPTETTPNKRLSVVTRTPLSSGTASSISPRGRSSMASSSPTIHTSRTTSTSTGSISGKRSTMSSEDHQQLKLRGKEVYARDSKYSEDRERERREREHAAKIARQEAAERSRQTGREWAEKQRQRRLASSNSTTSPVARLVVS